MVADPSSPTSDVELPRRRPGITGGQKRRGRETDKNERERLAGKFTHLSGEVSLHHNTTSFVSGSR